MAELAEGVDGPLAAAAAAASETQRRLAARLERLPTTRTHVKARIVVGLATFFDGFDSLSIAFVMPVLIPLWHLSPQQTGMLASGVYLGQVGGAIFFPWFAERFGRLRSTAYSAGLFGLASLLCAFATGQPSLLAARFVQGCGLGGEVPVAATYINEITRAPIRGRFFLMYEAAFAVGYVAAASAGLWLVPNFGWQSMFLVGAIPALIAAVMRRMLPESPRWLATHGRVGEAEAIIARMEREGETKLGAKLPAPALGAVPARLGSRTDWREFLHAPYLARTLVVIAAWFCLFFVTQATNVWLPSIYKTVLHFTVHQSLSYSFISYFLAVGSAITVALLIDRIGRRTWIAWALFLGALPLLLLAWMGVAENGAVRLMICATVALFCLSTVSVSLYVYTPELFPTRMRALGCGIGATARNIGATLSPTMVGLLLGHVGIRSVFLMLGLVPLVAAVAVGVWGIETKRRVLEEISP